ncbi:hypothetical protein C0J52_00676 [Blattella germanica]|nr:hypothetical protein C0J52_00676 [Blattella germanica]
MGPVPTQLREESRKPRLVAKSEDNSAIRRRRRRGDHHGVGSSGVSLSSFDGSPLQKSLLESSLLSQSSTSPSHSSRSESSPLKASTDLQSPPSRALLRLTADSGTHFLQARRTSRKTSPPVASPLKSSEREATPPPSKLKAAGTSLSVYSSTVQQEETTKSDKVSHRVERLMASARDAVARLNKISGESSSISGVSDNRQPLAHHESGLGDCSSTSIDTTKQKTVDKSDINHSAELPLKKTFSPNPDDDDLHSKIIPVNSSDSSPLENGSSEVLPRSRTNSPSKQPSSILKKKSLDEQIPPVVSSSVHQMPVSILKRKTSQDEAGSGGGGCSVPPPPVTFSPSVLEQAESNSKRQGILKKRCSLDESEVLRRRSCSPDMVGWDNGFTSDFRPILKNQRRSSMEELVRRTFSPDPQPQSILKRRTSRDDEVEERTSGSPEPQGILKRKSANSSNSSSSSTSPHVSIAASVIMNVVGIDSTSDLPNDGSSEQVRPILKKKSSSEDNTAADSSSTEAPKPILKKKASVDVDDLEDKPKKPILKSSRKSSQEDQTSWESASSMESPVRCRILRNRSAGGSDSASGSDCELVRPILKQPSSERSSRERSASPRHRLSFCDDQDDRRDSFGSAQGSSIPSDESRNGSPSRESVLLRRRLKQSSTAKSSSTSSMDNELSAILNKRRSLEVSADVESDTVQLRRSRSPVVMETSRGQPRPMSVAERVMNMENFLVQESSTKPTGAVPKRPGSLRASRDRERFHTQPITLHELHASSR